jgi:hypothetical protein
MATTGILAGGCGGHDRGAPPTEARQAVLSFLSHLQQRDSAGACALLRSPSSPDLRRSAAGAYIATATGLEARLAQIQAAHAKARTCPGALELIAGEIGPAKLARLTAQAHTLPIQWLGPGDTDTDIALGDQDWDLVRGDGRWLVDGTNALG